MTVNRNKSVSAQLRHWKSWYDNVIKEIPWLRAIGPVFSIIGVFVILITSIPNSIFSTSDLPYFWPIFITFSIFIYLLLTTVYANDRLRTERQLRQVEEGFNYDNRGTLWNGGEPNIAFRIETFKGILTGLNSTLDTGDLSNAMKKAGKDAASDFAKNFASIHESDIRSKKGGSPWDELRLSQKLHEWAEYDSSTGWGILAVSINNNEIEVKIIHLNGLYQDEGGRLYGYFIAGYCETVVSQLVEGQSSGKFAGCDSVSISSGPVFDGETATLTLTPQ